MHALLLISLCATSLGGAVAMSALFHYAASHRRGVRTVRSEGASPETFARSRRELEEYRARIDAELDAKRAGLEALAKRADEAARALGAALESASFALDSRPAARTTAKEATPFRFDDLDE